MTGTTFPLRLVEPLPADKELKVLERARAGDERAREILIERNVWLVADSLRNFEGNLKRLITGDLITLGTIGLIRSVHTFRPEQGIPFRAWARQEIDRQIGMGLRDAAEALLNQQTTTLEAPAIPEFRTEEEEAEFWASHSLAEVYEDTEPVKDLAVADELAHSVKERARTKRPVTLRLEEAQINVAKAIAQKKGLPYQTLIRMWIAEAIRREAGPAPPR